MRTRRASKLSDKEVRDAIDQGLIRLLESDIDLSATIVMQVNTVFKDTLITMARREKLTLSQIVRQALESYTKNLPGWKEFYQQNIIEYYQHYQEQINK